MKIGSDNLNINLRHVQAAQAVRQQGSFGRAAAVLGVVPSALSETMRQLEDALGGPLFDRRLRPPQPTPLGLQFLADTAPLLDGFGQAVSRARALAGLESGELSVGASPSAITGIVGPALARFRAAHPGIRCHLHDDIAERLAGMVVAGRLDLAVAGRARETPDLRQTALVRDRFGLACARTHRFAGRRDLRLAALEDEDLIALDAHTGTWQILSEAPGLPDHLRRGALTAHSTIAQLCLIRAGLGVGLLPEKAVALFGDPAICFVPVVDLDLWRTLWLLEPAGRTPSPGAVAFKALLTP